MYSVQLSSYYLIAVSTLLINITALAVVAYQQTSTPSTGTLAAIVLGAFTVVWAIMAFVVVWSAATSGSSKRFGTASVLVLLTAVVSLGGAIAAGYDAPSGGIIQGVSTTLFTILVVLYLALSFIVSEDMLRALPSKDKKRLKLKV